MADENRRAGKLSIQIRLTRRRGVVKSGMKKTAVFLADGFEEIEAITVIDILRRVGIATEMIAIGGDILVRGGHDIPVRADRTLNDVAADEQFDMVIIPGGGRGVENLAASAGFLALLERHGDGEVAAICAAPSLLAAQGRLRGKKSTAYPSFAGKIREGGAEYREENVVIDGNLITSRGPATAMEFALAVVSRLRGEKEAEREAERLLFSPRQTPRR